MEGKDLLVEYVEGENAGKALLSRVRMGMHLGEGYLFHADGAYVRNDDSGNLKGQGSGSLILMVTPVIACLI